MSHKHGYGDAGGVDCFGYAIPGLSVDDIASVVWRTVEDLGMIGEVEKNRVIDMDIGRESVKLVRQLERKMPPDTLEQLILLVTPEIWNSLGDRNTATYSDFSEAYWAWTFMWDLRGYTLINSPRWAWDVNASFSSIREKFSDPFGSD